MRTSYCAGFVFVGELAAKLLSNILLEKETIAPPPADRPRLFPEIVERLRLIVEVPFVETTPLLLFTEAERSRFIELCAAPPISWKPFRLLAEAELSSTVVRREPLVVDASAIIPLMLLSIVTRLRATEANADPVGLTEIAPPPAPVPLL